MHLWDSVGMWPFRQRSKEARNVLFDAALEFGKNWRRDIAALAVERLPEMDSAGQATLAAEIEPCPKHDRGLDPLPLGHGRWSLDEDRR